MALIDDSHAFQDREQFVVTLSCQCGQQGTAIWEENIAEMARGRQPILLEVSSGFYMRVRKKDRATCEIACAVCEKTIGFSRTKPVAAAMVPPLAG